MRKSVKHMICFMLTAIMAMSAMTACGTPEMEEFTGDLREKYDYNLNEYLDAGDYKGIGIYVGSSEPTKREIEARILENRVLYTATISKWESVGEGVAAEIGNIMDVRYQGYLDGEKLADVAHSPYKEEGYSITLGSDMIFEGVDEMLVGMKIGDKKTFEVTVPDPCFDYPYYVGKTITIEAEVTGIRSAELAPYDEEFAEYFGYANIEGFESYIVSDIRTRRAEDLRDYVLDRVMKQVLENFEVIKYPEKELKAVIDSVTASNEQAAAKESVSVEDYIKEEFDMTTDEYNENLEEYAREVVHMEMVMYYIARNEQIALTSAVFDEKASLLAEENGMTTPAEYVNYMAMSGYSEYDVREMIWFDLVYDFMYENTVQNTDK